ncbi:MAG: hypothetical protein JJE55_15180 [Flavobacteriaceae bacterium]|nr:hypothetical protein [Flavobacteriaceae bacterium]
MKKLIKLSVLLFVLGLSSCTSPLKKSVIEPLEIKDLKSIIEKDTLFELTYKAIQNIRETKLIDDVEKAKWSDITYERVHKTVKLYSDTLVQSKYTEKIKSDWNSKYGFYLPKADSISKHWKKYEKENSLNSYVSIELFDIQTEYQRVKIGFKITPLKMPLKQVSFDYIFIDKNEKEKIKKWKRYPSLNDNTVSYNYYENISEPKVYWKIDSENQDKLEDKILEEVLGKFVFQLQLNSITKDGVRISKYDIDIPTNIERMWENENDFMYDYYRGDVIKEFINSEFVRYDRFKITKIDSIARKLDPKTIAFLELNTEKE